MKRAPLDKAMQSHYNFRMTTLLTSDSTLTDRYQTTVPELVRRALNLGKRDKIHYTIRPNGEVVLTRAETTDEDPALMAFLTFLEKDMTRHPERLTALSADIVQHIHELTRNVVVDLDAPLNENDE